ncbi:PKP4 protein, partial [Polyodon spathula]|nr:PKP4 protein [Polyodon spathula]
ELQFERLTRELEVERQIVASQLERCRLGAESPSIASISSSEKSFPWRSPDAPTAGVIKPRATDITQSTTYRVRAEQEQVQQYSPEQTSLHERSFGNSRSSTQMNSYSDSGYQETSSYYSSQNLVKPEFRPQHSFPGNTNNASLMRNTRAEGQTLVQAPINIPGTAVRVIRRVSSVPSRTQSPAYSSSVSPSRGSLRTSLGSGYGSPAITEPKPLTNMYSTTALPSSQREGSPFRAQKVGSPSHNQQTGSSSPLRSGMTAVPQHYGSTLQRTLHHETDQYGQQSYKVYERMIPPRPDSLTGLRSSYASQHSQLGQDLRSAMSPDLHITPIYEGRTFQSPLYRSPNHGAVELHHGTQTAVFRAGSGVGNLQRTSSQRSAVTYQRSNYALNPTATYAEPYRSTLYRPSESNYSRHAAPVDDVTTRSPSIDSIQKDPRCRDEILRPIVVPFIRRHHLMFQHDNARPHVARICTQFLEAENVCRHGGIKHLVDLLDHKVLEVQKNACGALRNLVYGKAMDENKVAVRNAGGVPALLRVLRKTVDAEVRELVTGVLWNLSSCDAVKMTIVRDALSTLTNTVVIPHSGWSSSSFDDDHKLKLHTSIVLRNTTGCLRNLSSAGEESRKQMRICEGLVDSLLYVIQTCVNSSDYDSKIVQNCICTLRNLSYRLELEIPQARLLGPNELDGLLGNESPSKDVDSSCWGKKKKKKKKTPQDDQWDGVGPIPGFSKPPKGAEMLWHPSIVKPYLMLLAESSNPATLEGSAGSLQNLSAGNWKFAAYIRAAVRKEKGLPILVELLRMDNDRVVCSVATALRNMALDVRNKELIGKYAMRDLVNRLPGGNTTVLSDDTVSAICCTLHEVTSKNMENAKALADSGGIEKLVNITKGRGEMFSMKVVKAAAQGLNTLWQYRDLRSIYKKDGWNQNHFITPVSTLERDRYKSHPTLPTNSLQMPPVSQSAGSATSSPALLGIKEQRSGYQRTQPSMQFYNYQGDNNIHKGVYTGSGKQSPFLSSYSPGREEPKRTQHQQLYYCQDNPSRRNYDPYRMYVQSPHSYEDPYFEDQVHYPSASDYTAQQHGLKSTTNNYVDFYSTTRRPAYRAEQYPGSPDSWV